MASLSRRFLRTVGRALIGVVLVAQWAVAAHACAALSSVPTATLPAASSAPRDAAMAAADHPAPKCDGMAAGTMDPDLANLCAEHCHHGQQSDQAATLTVPAALLTALYVTPAVPEPDAPPRAAADTTSARVAACPPHAILHCCLRN